MIRALDAVAARLARNPALRRWIGPDDGVVVAQALALTALGWPGRRRWELHPAVTAVSVTALAGGGALAVAGGARLGPHLTPRVEPPEGADLHTDGVYAVSRNPIYAGLLVGGAGFAVLRRRPEPLLAWAALYAVLTHKVRAEEARLAARFGARYEDYRRRTPRFLGPPRP